MVQDGSHNVASGRVLDAAEPRPQGATLQIAAATRIPFPLGRLILYARSGRGDRPETIKADAHDRPRGLPPGLPNLRRYQVGRAY